MKQSKPSQRQSLKLPAIGNKTMDSIYRQSQQLKKQRPSSSKNVVGDLQKKLFSQLQAYQQKSHTVKLQKHVKTKSTKTSSNTSVITANSCKDISSHQNKLNNTLKSINDSESESMQKIAQLMPQLYSKILQSKKVDQVKPLKQMTGINQNVDSIRNKQEKVAQQKRFSSKNKVANNVGKTALQQPKLSTRLSTENPKQLNKASLVSAKNIEQQKPNDSFTFAQQQIDSIYQQYLQQQGILSQPQTSIKQLASLNVDLERCEVDIEQLEKNYSNLIRQLGDLCVRDVE